MKKIRVLTAVVLCCFALSCKKDNNNIDSETPIQTFIKTSTLVDTTTIQIASGSFEFGNKFYASRNGSVTHLGCYLPYKGNFRVSLWDFATKNLITAIAIASDSVGFVYVDIPDIAILANQRYVISVNNTSGDVARNYFFRSKKGSSANIYPFTSGSITYEGLFYISAVVPTFPVTSYPSRIGGFVDLKFK